MFRWQKKTKIKVLTLIWGVTFYINYRERIIKIKGFVTMTNLSWSPLSSTIELLDVFNIE